jgi:hypothetical protein
MVEFPCFCEAHLTFSLHGKMFIMLGEHAVARKGVRICKFNRACQVSLTDTLLYVLKLSRRLIPMKSPDDSRDDGGGKGSRNVGLLSTTDTAREDFIDSQELY